MPRIRILEFGADHKRNDPAHGPWRTKDLISIRHVTRKQSGMQLSVELNMHSKGTIPKARSTPKILPKEAR